MIKGVEAVTLFSANPQKLADFYKEKVGVKFTIEAELGEGEDLFGFDAKGFAGFYIVHHSKVKGTNKQPERCIINFEVDDMETEVKRLMKANVKLIQKTYHVENYGFIATFEDLDGNYFQLVKTRP